MPHYMAATIANQKVKDTGKVTPLIQLKLVSNFQSQAMLSIVADLYAIRNFFCDAPLLFSRKMIQLFGRIHLAPCFNFIIIRTLYLLLPEDGKCLSKVKGQLCFDLLKIYMWYFILG